MTPEQKLMALMAMDTPTQPDPPFEYAVLKRVAKQRAVAAFAYMLAKIVVGGGVLLACAWALQAGDTVSVLSVLMSVGALGVAGLIVWTLGRVAPREP
jgi:hypothetical protein